MRIPITRVLMTMAAAGVLPLQGAAPVTRLNSLIHQNINATNNQYRQMAVPQQSQPQLWIHVRSDAQLQMVQKNVDWLKRLTWQGRPLDIRPFDLVTSGPDQSQLRYFKVKDRVAAAALLSELSPGVAQLKLQDMSPQFQTMSWLKPGHLELWLAPGLTRFGPAH